MERKSITSSTSQAKVCLNPSVFNIWFLKQIETEGNIISAVFSRVRPKESRDHDFVLILQYRNSIIISSLFKSVYKVIDNKCKNYQFTYFPSYI